MAVSIAGARVGHDRKLLDWLDALETENSYWRGKALKDADRHERLYNGIRRGGDSSVPRFKANVVGPTIRRRNALLTENKPVFKVEPLAEGLTQTAKILNELADFAWQDHLFPAAVEEVAELASVFGAAGMSLPYDFEANGAMGSVVPLVRDPRSVGIDPGCPRPGDIARRAKYVYFETVECIWDLQHDFPGRGMEVKPERGVSGMIKGPGTKSPATASSGPISYRDYLQKLQEGPIPRARKKTVFIRDPARLATGELAFPLWRTIIRAGDVIIHDGPSPFWDGEPDLVWFENRRDFNGIWGQSEAEALRYLQGAINRIGEMFVNNTVLMGNSRVIADSDAIGTDVINRLTNAEALIITKKRQSNISWEPPMEMPPHFLQFITFALRLVDYLIGLNDGQLEGRGRVEMRSGIQLEGLQNAAQVLIRAMARGLETFIEQIGRKFIWRTFQFSTTDRILLATGGGNQFAKYKFEADKFRAEVQALAAVKAEQSGREFNTVMKECLMGAARQMAFRVQPLSSLAATKVARSQLLMQLVEAVMLPRRMVLSEAGFSNVDELLGQATEEAQAMAAMQIPMQGSKKKSQQGGRSKAA